MTWTVRALQQVLRRLLRRRVTYPRVVEGVLSTGRRYRYTLLSDPRTWPEPDDEPAAFTAPVTLADEDPSIDTTRPRLIPPLAVSLAAARQHLLDQAGLADDDDPDQERDRRLVWWFRRQRDQIDHEDMQ